MAALAALSLAVAVTPGVRGRLVSALSRAPDAETSPPGPRFSEPPTDEEFLRTGLFAQPLVPVGPTNPDEKTQLAALLVAYTKALRQGNPDAVEPLADFVAQHPHSVWTPGLELDLGAVYRRTGHFSKALTTWQSAWDASKDLTSSGGRTVGDMAVAYLSQFEAYLGRKELLEPLLEDAKTRHVRGTAAELISESSRGLAEMESRPDVAFKCGPSALSRILRQSPTADVQASRRVLDEAKSTPNGLSLSAVQAISVEAGMNYQMAHRSPGAPLLIPAVAHWKVGHYAALLGQDSRGHLLVADATFGEDIALTRSTFDEEASGYFLVRPGPLQDGWRHVDADEGGRVWGRGDTGANHDNGATGRPEIQAFPSDDGCGCTRWNVEAAVDGLELRDDPVGYKPPFGPQIRFPMTYSHRDTEQPMTFTYTNFGNKWTFGWLSYVTDQSNPSFYGGAIVPNFPVQHVVPVGNVIPFGTTGGTYSSVNPLLEVCADLYRQGGGDEPYIFPNTDISQPITTTQTSAEGQFSQAYLTRNVDPTTKLPTSFIRTLPDGSVEKFTLPQGTPGVPGTKFFMTEIDDPQGNAVTIQYDSQTRIVAIFDAAGQETHVCYNDSGAPCAAPSASLNPPSNLQVTQIIDPFGRTATFGYDSIGHLISITDTIGITSSFEYSSGDIDFIDQLTTPYGTTGFSYTDSTNLVQAGTSRSVTVTETSALGNVPSRTSRVEFRQGSSDPCNPIANPTPTVPAGSLVDSNGIECHDGAVDPQPHSSAVLNGIPVYNWYLEYRNTFIWNPVQYAASFGTPNQYLGAKVIHWLHTDDDTNSLTASRVPESTKEPLETRVWFAYPNQSANEFPSTLQQNPLGIGSTNQPSGIVRAVGDGSFQSWQFQYDVYGHVTQSVDPVGRTLSMTYDPTNNVDLLTVTNTTPGHNDPLLALSSYVQHRPQEVTGANGRTTLLMYNAVGQLVSSTDPLDNSWIYSYAPTAGLTLPPVCTGALSCGFLTGIVGPAVPVPASQGGGEQVPTYSFTYDNVGRLGTAVGPDNRLLTFYYDNADRLTETLFPDETTELRGYIFDGAPLLDLTSFTDRLGNTTNRQYDGFRDLIEIDEPLGRSTELSYWSDGTVQSVTDPLKNTTNYTRDVQGRLQSVAYPDNSTQWTAYDLLGRTVSTSPDQAATMPGTVRYAYNVDDTIAKAFLESRAPTVFAYDPAYKRPTGWSRVQGGTWAQPTCPAGHACTILDQESYTYYPVGTDGANRVQTVGTTIMPATTTAATGPTVATTSYGYDPLDRVVRKNIGAGPTGASVSAGETFQYDAIGRLTSDANLLDSFTYSYSDATARFSGRTSAAGPQVAASYFPPQQDGLLQQLTYTAPSGSALAQYSYLYDAHRNVTALSGSGVAFTYDAYNQISTDTHASAATAGGDASQTLTMVPDLAGNISSLSLTTTSCTRGGLFWQPPVCGTDQTSLVNFQYDSANKVTQVATTDGTDAPTVVQQVSYNSSLGSLTTIGAGATEQTYSYDNANRLAGYAVGTASPAVQSSGFLYDGVGRLSQVVDSVAAVGSTVATSAANHSYIWCGRAMCLEIDNLQQQAIPGSTQTAGLPDALYLAQGTVNNPTVATSNVPQAQLAYDVTDLLGSERAVVTNDAVVAAYDYDDFGNRTSAGSLTASNRGFAGLYYHAASGLQFARNRAYNSSLGRWMTRDPIGMDHAFDDPERFNATNLNLYAYAGNNPQSMVDPSGNDPLGAAIGGGLFGAGGAIGGFILGGGTGVFAGAGVFDEVTIPAGAYYGAVGGATAGYEVGTAWGDAAGDAIAAALGSLVDWAKDTGKEKASDAPDWAKRNPPIPGETGQDYANRILREKYGTGFPTGPGSEYSKIKKWAQRSKGCK